MNRRLVYVLTTLTALLLPATSTLAQRSGFSADGFFDRLDRDGSGVIEPEEIENSRMRRFVERMEIDTSRGITREQFSDAMEEVRQRYEQEREARRSESDDDERRDGDRRSRWNRPDEQDRPERTRERSPATSSRSRHAVTAPTVQPRVTIDLQSDFTEGDRDGDGQIGMYEWTQWKSRATLAAFLGMDRNGDGFLTPRELTRAAEAEPVDLASVLPIGQEAAVSVAKKAVAEASSDDDTGPTPETSSSTMQLESANPSTVIEAADPARVKQAERYFSLLDRDRDGNVTDLEWERSKRLKPKFEAAGADLGEPMSSDEFVSYYVRIFSSTQSGD